MKAKLVYLVGAVALAAIIVGFVLTALSVASASPVIISDSPSPLPGTPALNVLYVDGENGQDTSACGTTIAPCQTISYTVNNRAVATETIRVAQGVYTENLIIHLPVTLEGGYEASGWTRDPRKYETVIDGSGSQTLVGDWDGRAVVKAGVISDTGGYKAWFDGINLANQVQIGLATSSDGIVWQKYAGNPVVTGTPGIWDQFGEHAPFVLKENSTYKMWYESDDAGVRQLYYATSTNGIDWNKYAGNPVLSIGPGGYDNQVAGHGTVLNDGGMYKLWYHAIGDQGAIIAYATSPDGVNWTKHGPVLHPQGGNWDECCLWGPSVLKLNGLYWMWYSAAGPQGVAIGVVTSTNGITWTRFTSAPVLTDSAVIGDPNVISDGGKLKMWYNNFDRGDIRYAESTDGLVWTPSVSNPVLGPGTLAAQWGEPVVTVNSANVTLDGFTITGGDAEQAGAVSADTNTVIRDCLIEGNQARGAQMAWGSGGVLGSESLSIIDSRVINNRVAPDGAGGVRVGQGTLVMINTIVADNSGAPGVHLNGSATLINATVVFNSGPGVLFNPLANANLLITNSIVYSNAFSLALPGAGTTQVAYSDVQGGWAGAGNIDADPLFANASAGDYHLTLHSPAVDAGTNVGAPVTDFEGDARPVDGNGDGIAVADMGADELVPSQIYLPTVLRK